MPNEEMKKFCLDLDVVAVERLIAPDEARTIC